MVELKSRISGFTTDYKTGKQMLTLELNTDFRSYIDDLADKDLSVMIKQYRKKRSLDANAFFWATVGDISAKLNIPPEEIYREMIRDVGGNFYIVKVNISDVERVCSDWQKHGIGWICERLGTSDTEGFENVMLYYGSSEYDSSQMSRLCDLAVEEAKIQGIQPRLTAAERQAAIELWGERFEKHSSKE